MNKKHFHGTLNLSNFLRPSETNYLEIDPALVLDESADFSIKLRHNSEKLEEKLLPQPGKT